MENSGKNNNSGNTVLLTVIGVATLLVALVGATFAYFNATVTTASTQSVQIVTQTLQGLTYTSLANINLTGALPTSGNPQTGTGDFTLENKDANAPYYYQLKFVIDKNEFTQSSGGSNELVLSIKAKNEETITNYTSAETSATWAGYEQDVANGTTYAATKNIYFLTNGYIPKSTTQTFTTTLTFNNLDGVAQDNNQNKGFAGHIEVVQAGSSYLTPVTTDAAGA